MSFSDNDFINQDGMDEVLKYFLEMYESAEEGEENAHNIMITEDFTMFVCYCKLRLYSRYLCGRFRRDT